MNNTDPTTNTVDRPARARAAEIFRRFIGGQITNFEFENSLPHTRDPAIEAIWCTAWLFYSDITSHKLSGKYRLHSDFKRGCLRWILFLDSDLPYEWPKIMYPGNEPIVSDWAESWAQLRKLIGLKEQPTRVEKFAAAGHYPVWPFTSQKDYRVALRSPRRLSGVEEKAANTQ